MARETKVGLLAGLAFIICFAIILSNRGQRPLIRYPTVTSVDDRQRFVEPVNRPNPRLRRSPNAAVSRATAVVSASSQLAPRRGRAIETPERHDRNDRFPTSGNAGRAPAASGAEVIATQVQTHPATTRSTRRFSKADEKPLNAFPAGATRPQRPASTDRIQVLQEHLDRLSEPSARANLGARGIPASSPLHENPPRAAALGRQPEPPLPARLKALRHVRYVVKPGDTLSRIAAMHYGSRSSRFVDAIVDANRGVISNPDMVRAGVELMLPVLQGRAASSRQAPGHQQVEDNRIVNSASSTQSTTPNDERPIRWYQIKKNDRYVSIARSQLGDASRWRELFELNKDKFPDPQRIREGVRIKLPVDASPTPRGGGH